MTTSGNIATVPMGFLVGAAPPWPYSGGYPQDVPLGLLRRRKRNRLRVIGEAAAAADVPVTWVVLGAIGKT